MGWPVKVYNAIYSGEAKIQIPVFEVHARCYSAVMVPIARSDQLLISCFQDYKIRHELGESIESAVEMCEKWIRANMWQDVHVIEERKPQTQT